MSLKSELITILDNFASLLEFKGDNPFKINAFRNGANVLRAMEEELEETIKNGEIQNVKGLGKGLLSIINEYYEKGYSTDYNELLSEVPKGIMDFLKINGLGAKKIKVIYSETGINTLGELEEACREGRIASLKGFGEKTQENILNEIERINYNRNFVLQNFAVKRIDEILLKLKKITSIVRLEITGEFRRANEVISSIEFVILSSDQTGFENELNNNFEVKERFSVTDRIPELAELELKNVTGIKAESYSDLPLLLYLTTSEKEFNSLLFYTTGSPEFISTLKRDGHFIKGETTKGEFINSGYPFVIPEMRESQFFLANPELRTNSDLSIKNFYGLLHFHTTYSDGQSTLQEMVEASKNFGFHYLTVCDHSKAAFYANGLSESTVLKQKEEIMKVSKEYGIPVFHGIECDILKTGELDYSKEFLRNFDFIVASVHSNFKMTEDEMTSRIIRAVEDQNTDLLGHPTGRLLLSRAAYQVDLRKVIDACAANNVAIEINANPFRLDLDWRMIYYAREKGCLFSINPDAHSTEGIKDIHYGIRTSRKGGLQSSEVINCFELEKFKQFLKRKVNRSV